MSDFLPYEEPTVPTKVRLIEMNIISVLVAELDQDGEPTGVDLEEERLFVRAAVVDQDDVEQWVHTTDDYNYLIDKGVLTLTQLQNMRDFVQAFRDNVEGVVLPSAE